MANHQWILYSHQNQKGKKFSYLTLQNSKKIFPIDYLAPINKNSSQNITKNQCIYINLQKEYEEEKELIDLLDGKRK